MLLSDEHKTRKKSDLFFFSGKDLNDAAVDVDKENQQINTESQLNQIPAQPAGSSGGVLGAASPTSWSGGPSPNGSISPSPLVSQLSTGGNNVPLPLSSTSWHNCRKMIYVPRSTHRGSHGCFWPIPESYWPDSSLLSLVSKT